LTHFDSSRIIKGTTEVYGILGDPISHSLSPVMQNHAFISCGMDAVFIPFRVKPEALPQAVESLRALNVQGVNVRSLTRRLSVLCWTMLTMQRN